MRNLCFIMLFTIGYGCEKEQKNTDCVDEQKKDLTGVCIEIYQPVCGCDQKTYPNSCYAGINGLTSWTEGACE